MRVQQVAPIYTEKLGKLGWIHQQSSYAEGSAVPAAQNLGGGTVYLGGGLGQLRDVGTTAAQDQLGPYAYTMATTFGAGVGGGIIGFVAGKADNDSMWRGAIFSASLAGLGNGMAHLRDDQGKAFGAGLMIAALWGMFWAVKPMVKGAYRAAF